MKIPPPHPQQFATYVNRYCDESIEADELEQLEQWLRSDPACFAQFLLRMEIHSALAWQTRSASVYQSESGEFAPEEFALSLSGVGSGGQSVDFSEPSTGHVQKSQQRAPAVTWPTFPSMLGVQSLALVVVVAMVAWWAFGPGDVGAPNNGHDKLATAQGSGEPVVARLDSSVGSHWSDLSREVAATKSFAAGQQLELVNGSAKFRFGSGAIVAIEGPARFELLTDNSMRLEEGTVSVRADGPTKDFAVVCPDASIVDLGTSFGVHCRAGKSTEVEVFEGAVKVIPVEPSAASRVLGLGAFSRVIRHGDEVSVDDAEPQSDRFGDLMELLWSGGNSRPEVKLDSGRGDFVAASFEDPPLPEAVDTFYGSARGRGWLTAWMATGNPVGEIRRDRPLTGSENPYLRLQFTNSCKRTIAREYGPRNGFDPNLPHVISWKWRFDGNMDHFARSFGDRVHFFGNSSFRRETTGNNSWLIGLCAAADDQPVVAGNWYFFDRQSPGKEGAKFHERNMVDTGMPLKEGVVYEFAVVVYPQEARYDAAIRDDEQTVVRTGLRFRNGISAPARMLHCGVTTSHARDRVGFSLDSIRIEPWTGEVQLAKRLEQPTGPESYALPSRTEVSEPAAADGFAGIWYPSYDRDDEFGYKYAGGLGTFPQQHLPLAVYSKQANKTFFVYGGGSAQGELLHMVSYFDHASGTLARPRILDNKRTGDANDCPTLSIDAAGHLWVFANSHGLMRSAFVWRSVEPYSIDAFEQTASTNFSFAQPWPLASGETVLLHTRYGDRNAKSLYHMRSRDGRDWSIPELIAATERGHYQVSWQHGNRLGSLLNLHPNEGGLDARTNLYYLETADGGKTWRNAGGKKLRLPLSSEKNPALVEDFRLKKQLVYLKDLAYTAEGRPVALFLTSYGSAPGPNNGPRQFTTAHWDGSQWKIRRVTSTDHNYDHASIYIEPDGAWRMIGTTGVGPQPYQTGGEVEMWLSRDEGKTWEREQQLTSDSEFNHHYPRRPVNAHPEFYAFWADGHASESSASRLYFCTRDGRVYRMPDQFDADHEIIEPQLCQ